VRKRILLSGLYVTLILRVNLLRRGAWGLRRLEARRQLDTAAYSSSSTATKRFGCSSSYTFSMNLVIFGTHLDYIGGEGGAEVVVLAQLNNVVNCSGLAMSFVYVEACLRRMPGDGANHPLDRCGRQVRGPVVESRLSACG
jgi:hypothetical protein